MKADLSMFLLGQKVSGLAGCKKLKRLRKEYKAQCMKNKALKKSHISRESHQPGLAFIKAQQMEFPV